MYLARLPTSRDMEPGGVRVRVKRTMFRIIAAERINVDY
jgi:hypothetical protein